MPFFLWKEIERLYLFFSCFISILFLYSSSLSSFFFTCIQIIFFLIKFFLTLICLSFILMAELVNKIISFVYNSSYLSSCYMEILLTAKLLWVITSFSCFTTQIYAKENSITSICYLPFCFLLPLSTCLYLLLLLLLLLLLSISLSPSVSLNILAVSAGAVEYIDCISAE